MPQILPARQQVTPVVPIRGDLERHAHPCHPHRPQCVRGFLTWLFTGVRPMPTPPSRDTRPRQAMVDA